MSKAKLSTGKRQCDLPVVHMPGKDEIERVGLESVEDIRVVADENPEIRSPRQRIRVDTQPVAHNQAWPDACNPHRASTQSQQPAFVAKQHRRLELLHVRATRLRIARDREIVVSKDGGRRLRQKTHELAQARLAPRMRQEIPRDHDEVWLQLPRPPDRPCHSVDTGRRNPQVKVR